jgi:DNA helicase-2/ATP-dependent DNA helicase PcrA
MENTVFQKFYSKLNKEQKEAVDTLAGPVMVAAGPGTGKTQVLTLRIANILLQGKAKPEEILALTFTESGVAAMRKRLIEILGPKAYYIPIHTFHAFCNEIIQDNPDEFPQFFNKNVIDEITGMQILEGVIQEGDFKLLKPFGDNFMYVAPLLRAFSEIKKEGVGPQKLREFVLEEEKQLQTIEDLRHESGPHKGKMKGMYQDWQRNIEKNKEMVAVFDLYQAKLKEEGYDYDDMILSVVLELESNSIFLQRVQEQYKYLLADEHQDTNLAQNKVLELLCAHQKEPNIFVVGDEKQSIYRFQGASIANFLYFHSRFPNSKIITLKENYRSTQSILDAAGSVIPAPLTANVAYAKEKTRVYSFLNSDSENYFVARKIKKLIKNGADAREIAVLYRDNRDVYPIRDMLEKNSVPYAIESDEQVLENSDVRNLFLLIKAVSDFGSEEKLAKALHADFLKIPALDIYKLLHQRKARLYDVLARRGLMRTLGISKAIRLNNFYRHLSSWNNMARNKSAPQVFEAIVRESGFFDHILSMGDYIEGIGRVRLLHQLAKRLAAESSARGGSAVGGRNYTLGDFARYLELIGEKGVSLRGKKINVKRSAVRLMTAHRAKGLEFDYVFIVGANMGHWGKRRIGKLLKPPQFNVTGSDPVTKREQTPTDAEDDERRLFYVALTRARKQVYISYASVREDGREVFPSQFIEEIGGAHKTSGNSEIYEKGLEDNPKIFFVKRKEIRIKEDERDFLREVFEKRGLSPTALNNYLECPWKYFYNNLLQIPRAKTKHEMYGTAVHAALRDLSDAIGAGVTSPHFPRAAQRAALRVSASAPPPTAVGGDRARSGLETRSGMFPQPLMYLLTRFERALAREPISKHDFEESLQKGKETLSKYYANYSGTWHTNTINEFLVKNVFLDGEVRLTGKIDKIEILEGNKVNVVDYKTGKRKTRNALEGKTKDARGNEKRQLVFYKLLLNKLAEQNVGVKLPHSKYIMTSGEVDFVEPEKNTGKFYKEKFEITDDDARELEYKIQDVVAEILGFSFWNERCQNKDCDYCKLRNSMV